MAVRKILQLGNPLLWEESAPVERPTSEETGALAGDLDDTLAAFREEHGFGRGIAAPQIGVLKRVIYVRMPDRTFDGPMINPKITWHSDERVELWDACFSLPNLMVRVSRAVKVRVEYFDSAGYVQTLEAEGDLAELLQHEIDHLDGILAVERALSPKSFSTRAEWEKRGGAV